MFFCEQQSPENDKGGTVPKFILSPEDAGLRLDKVLATHLPEFSRTRLQELIAQGNITVDGICLNDASCKAREGMEIRVTLPPLIDPTPQPRNIPLDIVYEDADLIVINKPPNMVTHPAPGHLDDTLVNALLYHCGTSLSGINGVRRPGIVHRLDKETSGLLVVAKNDHTHHHLSEQIASRAMKRVYHAVAWGMVPHKLDTIEGAIARDTRNRQKMTLHPEGRFARTHCKVLQYFGRLASVIECRLDTGRTHQIRVHLTSQDHPLIGDALYGKPPRAMPETLKAFLKDQWPAKRQALHAKELSFSHPTTGEQKVFSTDLPADIRMLIDVLHSLT